MTATSMNESVHQRDSRIVHSHGWPAQIISDVTSAGLREIGTWVERYHRPPHSISRSRAVAATERPPCRMLRGSDVCRPMSLCPSGLADEGRAPPDSAVHVPCVPFGPTLSSSGRPATSRWGPCSEQRLCVLVNDIFADERTGADHSNAVRGIVEHEDVVALRHGLTEHDTGREWASSELDARISC